MLIVVKPFHKSDDLIYQARDYNKSTNNITERVFTFTQMSTRDMIASIIAIKFSLHKFLLSTSLPR